MKKERGITLVALVITVIIMLILAGVALSLITGEEGLFARANHSAQKYKDASQTEADRVGQLVNSEYMGGEKSGTTLTKAEIEANEDSITTKKATLIGRGEDSGSGIAKYEFYVDGALYQTEETEETSTSIELTFTKDSHVCYVRVYNKEGNYLDSTKITVNKHVHTDDCHVHGPCYLSGTQTNESVECQICGNVADYECPNHHYWCYRHGQQHCPVVVQKSYLQCGRD